MSAFNVGDTVMHFREGLAHITEIRRMNEKDYFIIRVVRDESEIIYVPVDTAQAVIRHVSSQEQAEELIIYIRDIQPEYITNTKQRRDGFKRRLGSGNIHDLAFLARQLYFFTHPEEIAVPVKFGPADVEMLKYATTTMYDELAITYNINRSEIESLFLAKIKSA
ncbi:MAG: hypothetical protein J5880_03115 [Bacilli bacterium]|nr:hypothetical protein [Bacilli bacterium]MBO4682425.1 hypothetical protein [Bacilli bacterium]